MKHRATPIPVAIDGVKGMWVPAGDEVTAPLPDGYLSPHFLEAEFTCNHCNSLDGKTIPQELLDVLEDVRDRFAGASVTINSGYRCPTHNKNVGGARDSRHLYADAADIVVAHAQAKDVYDYLDAKYPGKYGIGNYNSFTHIDVRPSGPARW